ncbi:MAG: hypothetical protein Q7S59_05120 [Sulfurimonas sp.]|nr:hypothetical protein [Sulfurimonas sp.]
MKLWTLATLCTVSLLILSGCGSKPTPSSKAVVDSSLPIVTLTQNGVATDMNTVAFEWQSVTDPRVEGIYIYRQNMKENSSTPEYYDTIDNRFATHYVDTKIEPDTKYKYSFKTFSSSAESIISTPTIVASLPVLQSVSWIHSIQGMPRSAKIIWRPHENKIVKAYIIEKRTLKDNDWKKIATIDGRFNAEYIDDKLEDNYVYKYRIRVLTYDGHISEPSEVVTSVTKALPKGITNISATRDLPRKIKVSWSAVSGADGFAGYHVYRSEKIDGSYQLIKTVKETAFADAVNEDGKSYFYRVSTVDKDGLESDNEKQSVQGQTLAKTNAPAISDAKILDNKIVISWVSTDSAIVSFTVVKKQKGWFSTTTDEFTGIRDNTFVDSAIEPETTYIYKVYGVDNNSIKSDPSIEAKFTTTKTQGKIIKNNNKKQNGTKAPSPAQAPSDASGTNSEEVVKPMQDMIEL